MARIDQVLAGEKSWGAWWLDQLGHTGYGAGLALPVEAAALLWFGWAGDTTIALGAGAAFLGGIGREIYQGIKSGKLHPADRTLDALFFIPGSVVAFGLIQLVRLFF